MIAFADPHIPFLQEALSGKVDVRIINKSEISRENLIKNNVEALFIRSTIKVYRDLLEGTNVKFLATATSGVDHVDLNYILKSKIKFVSAPGSNANSVAEYVIFSILKWHLLTGNELKGKKIGIVGFGNIGKLVAKYSEYLGLQILINDPPLVEQNFKFNNKYFITDLSTILTSCDIVTNHVPLTLAGKYTTNKLFNSKNLQELNEGALFIHTSRGKVVDEKPLKELITSKNIHLAIDVWENEPIFDSFLAKNSLLATPHLAGYSYDGKIKGSMQVLKEFAEFFNIEPDFSRILKELSQVDKSDFSHSNPIEIFKVLRSRRAFETDAHLFLEQVDLPDNDKEKAFIEIRQSYPKRRESLK